MNKTQLIEELKRIQNEMGKRGITDEKRNSLHRSANQIAQKIRKLRD